jgi:hypothetical protein
MVHNGIEYGDMQLISEAYHLMLSGLGLGYEEMANVSFITNGENFFGKRFKLKMLKKLRFLLKNRKFLDFF